MVHKCRMGIEIVQAKTMCYKKCELKMVVLDDGTCTHTNISTK